MSRDDSEATDPAESSLPDCPICGQAVLLVTVDGPRSGTATPCGCSVLPGSLERD